MNGGGISGEADWRKLKDKPYGFLFPVKAMDVVYRAMFLQALQKMMECGEVRASADNEVGKLMNLLFQKDWVIDAKASCAGPDAVIGESGRYTHKVAISNHQIVEVNQQKRNGKLYVKDNGDSNKQKRMKLDAKEFLRRLKPHILPRGFTKIRTYFIITFL